MRFAMRAAEQMAIPQLTLATTQLHNGFVRHWKEPLRESLKQLQWVQRYATEVAHLVFSCHGANMYLVHGWFCGLPLEELAVDAERYGKLAHRYGYDNLAQYPALIRQAVLGMQGLSEQPWQLQGESFNEQTFDLQHQTGIDAALVLYFHLFKLQLGYWFGHYADAIEQAAACHGMLQSAPGAFAGSIRLLYEALAHLQQALLVPAHGAVARQGTPCAASPPVLGAALRR